MQPESEFNKYWSNYVLSNFNLLSHSAAVERTWVQDGLAKEIGVVDLALLQNFYDLRNIVSFPREKSLAQSAILDFELGRNGEEVVNLNPNVARDCLVKVGRDGGGVSFFFWSKLDEFYRGIRKIYFYIWDAG